MSIDFEKNAVDLRFHPLGGKELKLHLDLQEYYPNAGYDGIGVKVQFGDAEWDAVIDGNKIEELAEWFQHFATISHNRWWNGYREEHAAIPLHPERPFQVGDLVVVTTPHRRTVLAPNPEQGTMGKVIGVNIRNQGWINVQFQTPVREDDGSLWERDPERPVSAYFQPTQLQHVRCDLSILSGLADQYQRSYHVSRWKRCKHSHLIYRYAPLCQADMRGKLRVRQREEPKSFHAKMPTCPECLARYEDWKKQGGYWFYSR